MNKRSSVPLRSLSVADLGLSEYLPATSVNAGVPEFSLEPLDESDPILGQIRSALRDGFAGVIFVGPPGTSKSWYAAKAAMAIAEGDRERFRFVQFHPSFQYEDFVEGYVPLAAGGFELVPKHLLSICEDAAFSGKVHVLVIDEISRCDAARVFGEALTYLETSKRGLRFFLSSGTEMSIPPNVVILATMNPWDRGVDDMDMALERRFAHIEMSPSSDILRQFLERNGFPAERVQGIVCFFDAAQKAQNPLCHIGHAYFVNVKDENSLLRLWDMQLRHHFARACRHDPDEFKRIESIWFQLVGRPSANPPGAEEVAVGDNLTGEQPQPR